MERIYTLTSLGKRLGSNIRPAGRDEIVDYIYSHGTVRLSEMAGICGGEREARRKLDPYVKRGLVQELTT